jgi:uncharacterized membrane protein
MKKKGGQIKGVEAALASALFLGVIPIFGKQAITAGFSPLAVVAFRTILAAGLLLLWQFSEDHSFLFTRLVC